MQRKDFLKIGFTGFAGIAAGGLKFKTLSLTDTPLDDLNLKKAFMLDTFPSGEYSLLQKFEMLRSAGFEGVEPPGGLERSAVKEAMEITGLEIPSIVVSTHWSHPLSSPDPEVRGIGRGGLETALYDAHEYGAKTVLLVPGVVNEEVSYNQVYKRSQEEIRNAIPLAEELGVVIAVENVWNQFLLSPMEAAAYVDDFDSPWVGWYFDIGNVMNYGWPEQWIRILGERIKMIHIKEFSREKRDNEGLWKGFEVNYMEGDNNWPEIVKALKEIGYSGYGIAEPPYKDPNTPTDIWLEEIISGRMDKIFSL
ncbi:MAG: sugar phosphate isomerase/epimerase family protein [Balneolaceae bacterium]